MEVEFNISQDRDESLLRHCHIQNWGPKAELLPLSINTSHSQNQSESGNWKLKMIGVSLKLKIEGNMKAHSVHSRQAVFLKGLEIN